MAWAERKDGLGEWGRRRKTGGAFSELRIAENLCLDTDTDTGSTTPRTCPLVVLLLRCTRCWVSVVGLGRGNLNRAKLQATPSWPKMAEGKGRGGRIRPVAGRVGTNVLSFNC